MKTESFWCRECDHEHECRVEYDDWGDSYIDVQETCESCGEPLEDGGLSDAGLRSAERQQMGVGG